MILPLFVAICAILHSRLTYGAYLVLFLTGATNHSLIFEKNSFSHLRYFLCYTFTGFGCNGFTKNDEGSHGLFLGTGL